MTMKSVDLPHLRSVVLAGHAGSGKTTLAEQLLFKAGAIPRLGRVDDGTGPSRFRARGAEAPGVAEPGGWHVRARRDAHLARRHAGLSGLRRRRHRGLRRGRRRAASSWTRRRGVEAGLEQAVALGRATNTAACFFINKCDRENAEPDRRARRAAGRVRQQDRATPDRDRCRGDVRRATSTSSTARPTAGTAARRSRSRCPRSWPTRSRRGATSSSRPRRRPTTTS